MHTAINIKRGRNTTMLHDDVMIANFQLSKNRYEVGAPPSGHSVCCRPGVFIVRHFMKKILCEINNIYILN